MNEAGWWYACHTSKGHTATWDDGTFYVEELGACIKPGRLSELCAKHGILYVDDEVQAGMGRTGPVWAIEHYGVEPDLLVSGKSLGGGLPLAGVTGRAEIMDSVHPGGLGGTFGGNPVSCAAALAVLDLISAPGFRTRAEQVGGAMWDRLARTAAANPAVGEVPRAVPAERQGAVLRRVDEDPADVGVPAQRGEEPRVSILDLLERQPPLLLHQVDEA